MQFEAFKIRSSYRDDNTNWVNTSEVSYQFSGQQFHPSSGGPSAFLTVEQWWCQRTALKHRLTYIDLLKTKTYDRFGHVSFHTSVSHFLCVRTLQTICTFFRKRMPTDISISSLMQQFLSLKGSDAQSKIRMPVKLEKENRGIPIYLDDVHLTLV